MNVKKNKIQLRRLENKKYKTLIKTHIKTATKAVNENLETRKIFLAKTQSVIDKATIKGKLHKNKASRLKKKLSKLLLVEPKPDSL